MAAGGVRMHDGGEARGGGSKAHGSGNGEANGIVDAL